MMANRLAQETSPYLRQHADNPVDWYPWGPEALEKAAAEDKPIFLSIGYSACHWCHVMAHESFEDERVASVMNEHFVNVKVDREERPDLDRIYMSAVQALTGRGGWPMSVFLTPAGKPFYGGTYFPTPARHGMPSFEDVLLAVADAWENRRAELLRGSQELVGAIQRQMSAQRSGSDKECRPETLSIAYSGLEGAHDAQHGGWGDAPKFPQPMTLEFLLRYQHAFSSNGRALSMVTRTLDAMARGGIYDQLGGGFHRYSVDDHWLVPHFEKMLYDNAQLARVYLHAWQVTGEPFYRTIVEETLDYVTREMLDPAGGFYATQDADTEGEEGRFFLWTPAQVRDVLGAEAEPFLRAYGVTEAGNFEGRNILSLQASLEERRTLAQARGALFEARAERVHPGRDEKVIVAWNGLMLAAFAEAAQALGRDDYRRVAERNADFLLRELRDDEGRLWHTWQAGAPKVNGYLEDYTHLIAGLLALYQTTFEPRWYRAAEALGQVILDHFSAPDGGFYDTSDDHEELIARPRNLQDNAVPSGNGMAALVLQQLAGLAVKPHYVERVEQTLCAMQLTLAQYPLGFGQWLVALAYYLAPPREIGIVGAWEAEDTRALLEAATAGYRPHQVVAVGDDEQVPLLEERSRVDGHAAAYICTHFTCRAPVTDPTRLRELLRDV
jgi:hypothetical protein